MSAGLEDLIFQIIRKSHAFFLFFSLCLFPILLISPGFPQTVSVNTEADSNLTLLL